MGTRGATKGPPEVALIPGPSALPQIPPFLRSATISAMSMIFIYFTFYTIYMIYFIYFYTDYI